MAPELKFTDEQKYEIALELVAGKLSHAEICRKYGISSTYAYKLKDRALEILRAGVGRPAGKPDAQVEKLARRVADLEQLAGDQALLIRAFKKKRGLWSAPGSARGNGVKRSAPGSSGGRAGLDRRGLGQAGDGA